MYQERCDGVSRVGCGGSPTGSLGAPAGAAFRSRPAHELGATALGERHLDRVEVAGRLGGGEHRARLVAKLAAGIAAGDVGEGEQPHLGVARQLGRLARGAVGGLAAPARPPPR